MKRSASRSPLCAAHALQSRRPLANLETSSHGGQDKTTSQAPAWMYHRCPKAINCIVSERATLVWPVPRHSSGTGAQHSTARDFACRGPREAVHAMHRYPDGRPQPWSSSFLSPIAVARQGSRLLLHCGFQYCADIAVIQRWIPNQSFGRVPKCSLGLHGRRVDRSEPLKSAGSPSHVWATYFEGVCQTEKNGTQARQRTALQPPTHPSWGTGEGGRGLSALSNSLCRASNVEVRWGWGGSEACDQMGRQPSSTHKNAASQTCTSDRGLHNHRAGCGGPTGRVHGPLAFGLQRTVVAQIRNEPRVPMS